VGNYPLSTYKGDNMTVSAIVHKEPEIIVKSNANPLPTDDKKRKEELNKRMQEDMKKFRCRFIDLQAPMTGSIQYTLKLYPNQPEIRQKLLSGRTYELTKMEIKHLMDSKIPKYDYVSDPVSGLQVHKQVGYEKRFSVEILTEGL